MLLAQSNELPVASQPLFPWEDLGVGLRKSPPFALSPPSTAGRGFLSAFDHLQPSAAACTESHCVVYMPGPL